MSDLKTAKPYNLCWCQEFSLLDYCRVGARCVRLFVDFSQTSDVQVGSKAANGVVADTRGMSKRLSVVAAGTGNPEISVFHTASSESTLQR